MRQQLQQLPRARFNLRRSACGTAGQTNQPREPLVWLDCVLVAESPPIFARAKNGPFFRIALRCSKKCLPNVSETRGAARANRTELRRVSSSHLARSHCREASIARIEVSRRNDFNRVDLMRGDTSVAESPSGEVMA
jgi:hypothetical protein